MNVWVNGAIWAVVIALCTVLINLTGAESPPASLWHIVKLAVPPLVGAFLTYIKQTPPPTPKEVNERLG